MFLKETMIRILIVEDDYVIADNLQALLQLKGFQVSYAPDRQTAVEMAREEMPHVMMLDTGRLLAKIEKVLS